MTLRNLHLRINYTILKPGVHPGFYTVNFLTHIKINTIIPYIFAKIIHINVKAKKGTKYMYKRYILTGKVYDRKSESDNQNFRRT